MADPMTEHLEHLARALCRTDMSWAHHDQTNAFPCTSCWDRAGRLDRLLSVRPGHTRLQTAAGPDFCAECSAAVGEWIGWPCSPEAIRQVIRAQEPPLPADVEAVLAAHVLDRWVEVENGRYRRSCTCGHLTDARDIAGSHRAHLATALAPLLTARDRAAKAEALREARDDIKARLDTFSRLNADPQYMNALHDAWGLVSNRMRDAE